MKFVNPYQYAKTDIKFYLKLWKSNFKQKKYTNQNAFRNIVK